MTINELREARNKAWQGTKAFVESKRDKDGLQHWSQVWWPRLSLLWRILSL